MRPLVGIMVVCCALSAGGVTAQQRPILSPRDSVSLTLDTNTISVNYGRPSMRGRVIMGGLVPWDKVWRTGANEATHLKTNFDMMLDGVPVPRGTYTLWTLPSPTGWKMIINKQTGQWGTKYDERLDLARFDATVEHLSAPVDTFTIRLEPAGKTSGILRLLWETTGVSTTFEKNNRIRPISPNDSAEISLGGKSIVIRYGRPFIRGRKIWGVVVPFDSVWRTGAGRATWLLTSGDILLGSLHVPKGSYTVYSLPSEDSFTLIVSSKPGGGEPNYARGDELGRIVLTGKQPPSPVDPFRIWFEPAGGNRAALHLGWAERIYSTTIAAE